ncbi:hypothetical protein S83_065941, partial [Arachis hypogaea]
DDEDHQQYSDIDIEREEECGICMEVNSKIVLPNCIHAMCLKCYREWYSLFLGGENGAFDKTILVALWTPNEEEVIILMSVNSAEFAASTAQRANREPEIVVTKTRA